MCVMSITDDVDYSAFICEECGQSTPIEQLRKLMMSENPDAWMDYVSLCPACYAKYENEVKND